MRQEALRLSWHRIARASFVMLTVSVATYAAAILARGSHHQEEQVLLPADDTVHVPYTAELSKTPTILVSTSVCNIVSDPQEHLDKVLIFDASVRSDCRHGTVLVDKACDRGFSFRLVDMVAEESYQQIGRYLCQDPLSIESPPINARFAAVLRREQKDDGTFPFYLDVHSISEVTVVSSTTSP